MVNGAGHDAEEATAVLRDVLAETGLFASVEASSEERDLHLVFTIHETFDEGVVYAWSFLCGFTFFVFPAFLEADYALEATLVDGGVVRGSTKVADELHVVMQILMLPAMPFFWPPRVGDDLLRNLALHAVRELVAAPTP